MFSLTIPDLWQQDAVQALRRGQDVVVHAPTGAGKTYVFELFAPAMKGQAIFTVPTRALANDKLAEWQARGWDVGLATGDLAFNLEAKIVVATRQAAHRVPPRRRRALHRDHDLPHRPVLGRFSGYARLSTPASPWEHASSESRAAAPHCKTSRVSRDAMQRTPLRRGAAPQKNARRR